MSPAPSRNAEFNRGNTYERYSGEHTRGRVTAEGVALGTTGAAATAGASSLAGAKLAGSPIGQQALTAAEHHATLRGGAAGPAAAGQLARYRRYGALASRHRASTAAGIVGLVGTASLARVGQKMRQNEEAGISQSVGRMKAGEGYQRTQVLASKSLRNTLGVAALGNDLLSSPRLVPATKWVERNRTKLTIAGLGAAGAAGATTVGRAGYDHRREFRRLRAQTASVQKWSGEDTRQVLHGVVRPKAWVTLARQNPVPAAIGAAGVVGGAAAGLRRKDNGRRQARGGAGAAAGAVGGQLAYYGAGFSALDRADRLKQRGQQKGHNGISRSGQEKLWRAHRKTHGVTQGVSMTPRQQHELFASYPKSLPGSKYRRFAAHLQGGKYSHGILAGATAAGAVGGGIAAGGTQFVRPRRTPQPVAKGGRSFALAGALTGGGALGTSALLSGSRQKESRDLAAGTVGGWAGQGVYQGAGYGVKHYGIHALEPKTTNNQRNKALRPVKAKHGAYTPAMERNYPKKLPEAWVHRTLGWTHRGKTGTALGAVATAGGTLAGIKMVGQANAAGHKKTVAKQPVHKLYVQDQQFSPSHLLMTGAGLGLAAWGLGRSGLVGRALATGLRSAHRAQNPYAVEALQRALAVQGVMRSATVPGERALRSIRAVDQAVNRVPASMRPEIATAAGALLVSRGHPIRRNTYHPVSIRIRSTP